MPTPYARTMAGQGRGGGGEMQKKDPLKTPSNTIDVHKHVRIFVRIIRAQPA